MQIFLFKDPSSQPGDILAHVHVSASDDPVQAPTYSHSFRFKVPSGRDGEIIVYTDKDAVSKDVNGVGFFFDLEKCRNKECKRENPNGCPVIAGRPNRLPVADVFHTMPTQNTLQHFGMVLFKALFSHVAEQLLEQMDPNSGIFLQFNDDDLDAIPWEYAKDGESFLVHRHKFTRVLARRYDPLPKLPLRIVVATPDPLDLTESGYADLHLGDQFQNFINEFRRDSLNVTLKLNVTLERVFPATVDRMNSLLAKHDNNMGTVLHFMGHCPALEETRGLLFEDEKTFNCRIAGSQNLVTAPTNLRLAFLSTANSCEIARDLVQNGVRQTIGSYCPLPDDIARKFEIQFYHHLMKGLSVDEAMCEARKNFQDSQDLRESNYLAGVMILYSTTCQTTDNVFLSGPGELKIKGDMFPNNFDMNFTREKFFGRKEQLAKLKGVLRHMASRTHDSFDICTITGIGGQGKTMLVKAAISRSHYFFPGGIFFWQFDDEKEISARDYLRGLAGVLFSEAIQNSTDEVEILGQAISDQFKASSLLILDHAGTLKHAAAENKPEAVFLVNWLTRIISRSDSVVKILATSQIDLGWPGENLFFLDGFSGSDIISGCRLFIENLSDRTKTKMQNEGNIKPLLRELVIRVNGHPLSLELLGMAASLPKYIDKSPEEIFHEHYSAMLADADVEKVLKRHFGPRIDSFTEMERSLLCMCSLYDGMITAEILAFVRYFVDYDGDFSVDSVANSLENFCKDGYLSKENDAYRIHIGFREGLRQHNDKLNIGVCLPKIGPVDAFTFGIPSKQGKSDVLEWQLRNMQSNSDNAMKRTFGIQIVNNSDTSNYEPKLSFRGLVVFTFEASESFLDAFAELSAKQIKPIVETRELPFILYIKRSRTKMANQTIENTERNMLLKAINTLQGDLMATHLIIKTEPLPNITSKNFITKKPLAKTTSKRKLAGVPTHGDFVGREKELNRLKELLDDNSNKIRCITILASGGMGKTTLAIQAVSNFDSDKVLKLSFVKMPSFSSMISKIAEFLRIDINDSKNIKADMLEKLEDDNTVLFYLDNLETLQQAAESNDLNKETERKEAQFIIQFFNDTPINVKILATSRTVIGWPEEYLIRLMGLGLQDGMQVFRQWTPQRLNDFSDEDAKKISEVTNGHPLSIRLLGGAFNKCKRPISEFIDDIHEHLLKPKNSLNEGYDAFNVCIQYSFNYLDETLKQLLRQLRRFITPFSATLVSKALKHNTTSPSSSSTKDDLTVLYQHSWLNEEEYILTFGDWLPRFMESDIKFYTLHPTIREFFDCQFGDIEVADFDDPDIQFYTALCYATGFGVVNDLKKQIEMCTKAAENGYLEAQLSLAACFEYGAGGVSLNEEEAFNWYLKAAEAGDRGAQYQVAKCYLFGIGVDANRNDSDYWRKRANDNGTQPLEMKFDFTLSLLHRAAEYGQVDLVSSLIGRGIKQGSVRATIKDRHGRTPLHLAAEKGHNEMVKLLAIEFNAEINAVDKIDRTPLHLAASNGHTQVVQLLVTELGADVRTKDKDGRTLLHVAAAGGIGINVILLLLGELGDAFQIDAKDKKGRTPLHWAAQSGRIDVMKMLVAKFGDVNAKNEDGRTPLHMAAENGHFEAMRILVAELGADQDEKDNNGGTLLHYAVKGGLHSAVKGSLCSTVNSHIDVMSLLVAELVTGINLEDNRGRTLLHWAAQGGQVEAMKQLMPTLLPTELSFEDNGIRAEGAHAVAESLKQNTSLTNLNLEVNNIGAEGARALAQSLKQNTALMKLSLKGNEIGDKGARALADSLGQNTTLTELNLEVNNIGSEGTRILAQSLKQNKTLVKLNLNDNKIGDEGAHVLAGSLEQNKTLIELNLTVNHIGVKGACALAESLKHNTTLTGLDLGDNEISDEGARALAESLTQNTTLTNLNLRGNKIGAKGACSLAESLKQNTTLTELNLEGNIIGDEGARTLSESLKQNTTLTELNLKMIGHNTVLAESLNRNKILMRLFNIIKLGMAKAETESNTKINNGGTPLLIAKLRKPLTEFGKDINSNGGLTPLHVIVAYGHIVLVKLLAGEFRSDANSPDNNGWTPLHMATARGYDEVVRLLVTELGANPNAKDNDGKTPLHRAAENGHVNIVKLLATEHRADITAVDNDGYTLLHRATHFEHINVMKLLVTEFKVDINAKGKNEWTPVHCFAQAWFFEIMDLLMAEFAGTNAGTNAIQTSFDWVMASKKVEMMKLLVPELGTDTTIKAKVESKVTQYLVHDWYVKVAKQLVTKHDVNSNTKIDPDWYVKVTKLLVVRHADPYAKDKCGWTPLQLAEYGYAEALNLLSQKSSIGTNIKDNGSGTDSLQGDDGKCHIRGAADETDANTGKGDGQNPPDGATEGEYMQAGAKFEMDENKGRRTVANDENDDSKTNDHAEVGDRKTDINGQDGERGANVNTEDDNRGAVANEENEDTRTDNHAEVGDRRGDSNGQNDQRGANVNAEDDNRGAVANEENDDTRTDDHAEVGDRRGDRRGDSNGHDDERGANVNAKDDIRGTLLHIAAENGHLENVRSLAEQRGDVNAKNRNGRTPLHLATERGHVDLVKLLVAKFGADHKAKDTNRQTPLHMVVDSRHIKIVKLLVEEFGADTNSKDCEGRTPLHIVADRGCVELIKLFVIELNVDTNTKDNKRRTPLDYLVMRGHVELVRSLVDELLANRNTKDKNNWTPLHLVAAGGHFDVVELLAGGSCDVQAKDKYGITPLHLAANGGHLEVVQLLLDKFNACAKIENKNRSTPLHLAAAGGHVQIVRLFVTRYEVDVNVKNVYQCTPLHLAAANGHMEVVCLLGGELKADVNAKNSKQLTPLDLAAKNRHFEVVGILQSVFGADMNIKKKYRLIF